MVPVSERGVRVRIPLHPHLCKGNVKWQGFVPRVLADCLAPSAGPPGRTVSDPSTAPQLGSFFPRVHASFFSRTRGRNEEEGSFDLRYVSSMNKPWIVLHPQHTVLCPPILVSSSEVGCSTSSPSDVRGRPPRPSLSNPGSSPFRTRNEPGRNRCEPGFEPRFRGRRRSSPSVGRSHMRVTIDTAAHVRARLGSTEGRERERQAWLDSARCARWPQWQPWLP